MSDIKAYGMNTDGSILEKIISSYTVLSSDQSTTNTTLTDITGLSCLLAANSTYEIEAVIIESASADTNGTQFSVNLSNTTGATVYGALYGWTTSALFDVISTFNTDICTTVNIKANGATKPVYMKMIVVTGSTAPTFQVQHRKVTSGTTTTKANSYIKATKIS